MVIRHNLKHIVLLKWLYILFFASFVFSFRFFASVSIGLIFAAGLIKNKIETGSFFNRKIPNLFLTACYIFFILQLVGLLYNNNMSAGLRQVQLKSALIFIPSAIYFTNYLNERFRSNLMRSYILIIVIATIYCLVLATRLYYSSNDPSVFFYHNLVNPLGHNAVQFSIFIFSGLIFLLESARSQHFFYKKSIHFGTVVYLILFIILLSSKLIIASVTIYLIFYLIRAIVQKRSSRNILIFFTLLGIIACIYILFTPNFIRNRYSEVINGNVSIIAQKTFDQGEYFNGLQFRLLEWRFVVEILYENNAWLTGVSPGDAQAELDKKYISANMYTGIPQSENHGFLGYNAHNQFLESVLQSGIPGLLIFILICFAMVRMAIRKKNTELTANVLLLLAYSFTESVLETQYGLVIFTFFPVFLYASLENEIVL